MAGGSIHSELRILVLDDDATVRYSISEILSAGYSIKTASTYSEFTDTAVAFDPHIILLDVVLPDANGIDICRQLRQDENNDTRFIIMITSSTDSETIESGYNAGADDFIRKPFISFELKSKITIFGKILTSCSDLRGANSRLLRKNRQLTSFSEMAQKNINISELKRDLDLDNFFSVTINPAYYELIKIDNDECVTLQQKDYGGGTHRITFSEIAKYYTVSDENKIHRFVVQQKHRRIYCLICPIRINNKIFGYILMEKTEPFKGDDLDMASLLSNYISLINNRLMAEDSIKINNQAYKSEINKIRKIQVSLLPDFKNIAFYDIASAYLPAQELSGDFFDAYFLDGMTFQKILCDVSGHGIASSYVGNQIRTLFRTVSSPDMSLSHIAGQVNDTLARDMAGLYYYGTVVLCRIDLQSGNIAYLNAGHPPALLYKKATGTCKTLNFTGPIIGIFENKQFGEIEISLEEDDCLFIYTDGITEAAGDCITYPDQMYSEERLIENFMENQDFPSRDIIHFIIGSVYEFTDYQEQNDDMTAICIKKRGA